MTNTVSARISNELHEKLRDRCNDQGHSINDYLVGCIELALYGCTDIDLGSEDEDSTVENHPTTTTPTQAQNVRDSTTDEHSPPKARNVIVVD